MTVRQKFLEDFDDSASNPEIAEHSRPRRQYRDDQRTKRKPQGRKREKGQKGAKRVNWHAPFLWSQIETAAARAGKPWRPRAILQEAQKMDRITFSRLTEQVIGRWIDTDAKSKGGSKWSSSVMKRVAAGNSPGGHSTRTGILVRKIVSYMCLKTCLTYYHLLGSILRFTRQD